MRRAYQGAPMQSRAKATTTPSAKALCSSVARSIGTAPTPISPSPTSPMNTRITGRAPRRIANRRSFASAPVSAPDRPAMPAPDTMTATLKHAAARSFEVPSVLKLCTHHSPVGVMLMLARLPAASSIATRLNARYASWSSVCRCSRYVPNPNAAASRLPNTRWPPGSGSNASAVKCTASSASVAHASPFAAARGPGPSPGSRRCAIEASPACEADTATSTRQTAAPPASAGTSPTTSSALAGSSAAGARTRARTTEIAAAMSTA
ncbi:hypothetical protein ACFVTX_14870 [Agromyces sp. NPDC058136]|uniref:hypothetical protein n=1 Tax=Agromyces sp. NPDC058136 TaxID=3346354 RepID=UPI0036D9E9D7